jgi:hypothetical protein
MIMKRTLGRLLRKLADKLDTQYVLRRPDELDPGDRILVECAVYLNEDDYPPGSHVHVRPISPWNGDYVWTWSSRHGANRHPWVPLKVGRL